MQCNVLVKMVRHTVCGAGGVFGPWLWAEGPRVGNQWSIKIPVNPSLLLVSCTAAHSSHIDRFGQKLTYKPTNRRRGPLLLFLAAQVFFFFTPTHSHFVSSGQESSCEAPCKLPVITAVLENSGEEKSIREGKQARQWRKEINKSWAEHQRNWLFDLFLFLRLKFGFWLGRAMLCSSRIKAICWWMRFMRWVFMLFHLSEVKTREQKEKENGRSSFNHQYFYSVLHLEILNILCKILGQKI